ncbi:MAG: hypothetical protein COB20_14570 [SAR86 cluster bacterium]|uniref:Uncharacterized protein n=1 Tax=SAR86 cluster bacterium TaxID=2030880 RepID=A0A2A4WY62_9GAMM|nr:MAG: hypothetical protein COB20_14570 [SAR86 cluster bacterium]
MKLLSRVFAICLLMSAASISLAHEGHEHAASLDQAKAVETAGVKIKELIDEGKLTSKWATKAPATAELVRVDGIQNWVVSYMDENMKERLQLIFTTAGEYVSMDQSNV